jgi:hypothetical protein
MQLTDVNIKLSILRGMLGEITGNMRYILYSIGENSLSIIIVYTQNADANDIDCGNEITTGILADLHSSIEFDEKHIKDSNIEIKDFDGYGIAYMRYEGR